MRRTGPTVRAAALYLFLLMLVAGFASFPALADTESDLKECDDYLADQCKRIEACTRLIDSGVGVSVERADLFNKRADARQRLGAYTEALADRNRAIRIDRDALSGYCGRGELHALLGNDERARMDLKTCIALASQKIAADPGNVAAYRRRAQAYAFLERHDAAISDVGKALELAPDDGSLWLARGYYHQIQGKHRLAIADLTRSIRLGHPSHWQRAQSYTALQEHEKALDDIDRHVAAQPEKARQVYFGHAGRARIYASMGALDRASIHAKKATSLIPGHPTAQLLLGYIHHLQDRHRAAILALSRALDKRPESHRGLFARGYAYEQTGNRAQAISDYLEVLSLDDPTPEGQSWDPWAAREDRRALRKARARLRALGQPIPGETGARQSTIHDPGQMGPPDRLLECRPQAPRARPRVGATP